MSQECALSKRSHQVGALNHEFCPPNLTEALTRQNSREVSVLSFSWDEPLILTVVTWCCCLLSLASRVLSPTPSLPLSMLLSGTWDGLFRKALPKAAPAPSPAPGNLLGNDAIPQRCAALRLCSPSSSPFPEKSLLTAACCCVLTWPSCAHTVRISTSGLPQTLAGENSALAAQNTLTGQGALRHRQDAAWGSFSFPAWINWGLVT